MEITGVIQNYSWGKRGLTSEAAKLFGLNSEEFLADPLTPYAELWFGTHPKGPSRIKKSGELLMSWLRENPEICNQGTGLPFLLKVLSVEAALSIQIHPSKTEAIELHARCPNLYPDDNHKPEMAIALTPFEALCGFRPWHEIAGFIRDIEELGKLVGQAKQITPCNGDSSVLKTYFIALMSNSEDNVRLQASSWANKIKADSKLSFDETHKLFLKLDSQYPGDIGCFCVYFLNYILLQPGQSIFLRSGLPHAYINGDCIECMACSDNVIRAGLTPKFRDVETLCKLVEYSSKTKNDILFVPSTCPSDAYLMIYDPPTPEFSVDKIELPANWHSYSLRDISSPSLLLVVQGSFEIHYGETLKVARGSTLFVGPNETLHFIQCVANCPVVVFRAYY